MTDFSGYRIKETKMVRDSLDRADLHIDTLKNGISRLTVVLPRRDGISRHIVFEVSP